MEKLKSYLENKVSELGICESGMERLRGISDRASLIAYYIQHPDWCLERGFPDIRVLREFFSDCSEYGVFVDRIFHGELLNDSQTYIFHNCKGTINVGLNTEKAIIPMLYLANGSRLHIVGVGDIKPKKASERSIVPIYTFGKNDVSARDNRYVKFTRYKTELI